MNLRWLLAALASAAVLAALHIWAIMHFIYWKYRWFDTPMHMLGGATIGLIAIGLLGNRWQPWRYLALIALAAFGWELFEYVFGITGVTATYYVWDTAHDVLNDVIGAVAVYFVARHTVWKPITIHD
ncbi:MAG TPA: hypothetical protein VHB93_01670 [Candidatus Paceibacterota bacterium]|nr:hypothetical protein [Candidatus Paceibacterota bacterium]